jgi:uncharacterized protein YjbJ (UPF0337 family)
MIEWAANKAQDLAEKAKDKVQDAAATVHEGIDNSKAA